MYPLHPLLPPPLLSPSPSSPLPSPPLPPPPPPLCTILWLFSLSEAISRRQSSRNPISPTAGRLCREGEWCVCMYVCSRKLFFSLALLNGRGYLLGVNCCQSLGFSLYPFSSPLPSVFLPSSFFSLLLSTPLILFPPPPLSLYSTFFFPFFRSLLPFPLFPFSPDMAIYGELPVSDCLSLVVCRKCNRVIKSEALIKHNGESWCRLLKELWPQLEVPIMSWYMRIMPEVFVVSKK